jgi:hypothetical protein
MIRLLRLTLLLCCLWSPLIVIAQRIGATQPTSPFFAEVFTNPDGSPCEQPCMFGVRPGLMSEDEALAILKTHPLTSELGANTRSHLYLEGPTFSVQLGDNVNYMALTFRDLPANRHLETSTSRLTRPLWGDVINYFGLPDSAQTTSYQFPPDVYGFYYRSGIVTRFHSISRNHAGPGSRLVVISISQRDATLIDQKFGIPWQGFANLDRYQLLID